MPKSCRYFAMVAAVIALAAIAAPAAGQAKINVLLIDGQNNHGWAATTPVIKVMLEKTGRFTVDVLTSPPKGAPADAWANFKPDLAKYRVVFSNYNGQAWPAEANKALEKYMADGGGLVIFHAANNAFTNWPEWTKMVGLLWQGNTTGDRLTMDDSGKVVRTPKGEGPGAGHGPQWAYEVRIRDAEHPITRGLPPTWRHAKDELYQGMRGPAENVHILVTAFAEPAFKGTGTNEPMVFTVTCGKGRVFVNLLGHDATSVAHPGCAALMVRGTEWAATGAVTIPAPADIPSAPATPPPAPAAPKADAKR